MPKMPRISDSEWLVMKVLWGKSPVSTTDVVEALESTTHWSLKTVLTLLSRLVKKGAVAYGKQGRAYQYYPLVDQKDCIRAENRSFLERVYDGGLAPMLVHFFKDADLSAEEIQQLREILEEKERGQ